MIVDMFTSKNEDIQCAAVSLIGNLSLKGTPNNS